MLGLNPEMHGILKKISADLRLMALEVGNIGLRLLVDKPLK